MVQAGLPLAEMLAWDGVAVVEHQHELAAGSGQQLAGAALVRHIREVCPPPDLLMCPTAGPAAFLGHGGDGHAAPLEVPGLRAVELSAGQLVALEGNVPHDVEAIEESAFLVTIAWPAGPRGDDAGR